MTAQTVLVAGATGTQGGAVADHLLERGIEVHALTRDAESDDARLLSRRGAEVVEGDMTDRDALDPLVADVDGVYCVTTFAAGGVEAEVEQGVTTAEAAADAGVDHFVFSSVAGADRDTGIPHFESKREIERRIDDLGLPATVVRPVFFVQNFEGMREGIEDGRLAMALEPRVPLQMVDADNIGAIVAEAFGAPEEYVGETFELASDELTLQATAARFADLLDAEMEVVHVPIDDLRESRGEEMATMFEWFNEEGYDVDLVGLRREHDVAFTRLEEYLGRVW
ncbi:NmrA/HSCARG family protein [Halegenticoccus tardaugens]|uniref:NmrA/HSCARG family protein n=1 Tax=Halegenticoccus tardaugens TaxID=2071624 RepID=UPI00100A5FEF|nr:NmrA/HSCARG family protein [Halegenticoccus tardaugens]